MTNRVERSLNAWVIASVTLLACTPSDFTIEVKGDLAGGITIAISDANGHAVDIERIRMLRLDEQEGTRVVWEAEGNARLGAIRYGASIDGMKSTVEGSPLEPSAAYRIEGVGRSVAGYWKGTMITGERYFEIDSAGVVKLCGPCTRCSLLTDVFGPCSE